MARKFDFTRTVKGATVQAKVFNPDTDGLEIKEVRVAVQSSNKDFIKVVTKAVEPMHFIKVDSVQDYEELIGWTLDEIIAFGHKLVDRNGKEVEGE